MIAKITILFAALAAVHASALLGHGALISTGVSNSARSQDVRWTRCRQLPIRSRRCPRKQKGIYTIADIDGRARRVDYVADGHGFRATVKTNEPGTAASAPAAALIASPYAGPVAPVVNHVAPAAPAVAAPLALAAPAVYGGVLGHGAALGLAAPAGLAYGGALGLGHGALGLGLAAPAGLAYGAPLALGHGLGLGKALLH
ncbi:adult-specific rigid cuticular protein 15.7 [Trichonephila clavata]|uniref:Adult-specific rigid cuticular protein 15.7 n=1 Tax=Trichonephila clavata TaxID=2740835 RepID=A0A8X6J8U5_TRICU|nr:adult-specific rigid cuticular protein 15.7 [Trichonephila clavata]